jgi:hypothetical protein
MDEHKEDLNQTHKGLTTIATTKNKGDLGLQQQNKIDP